MSAQIIAAQQRWRILHPWDGEEYFTATELDQTDYLMELRGLEHRWHDVAPHVFTSGQVCDGERSQLLVPSLPFDEKEWENRVSNVSKAAKIMIPVYAYTVAEDIDWALIKRLKVEYYGKTVPRTHDKVLATRLKAWDLYQHLRSFVEVAKQTSLPVSTVKHHYLVACRDIIGKVPAGTTKRRRIFAFDPETHVKECTRCRTEEQLCPAAEAFASQDYKALDEMLGTRDDRRQ